MARIPIVFLKSVITVLQPPVLMMLTSTFFPFPLGLNWFRLNIILCLDKQRCYTRQSSAHFICNVQNLTPFSRSAFLSRLLILNPSPLSEPTFSLRYSPWLYFCCSEEPISSEQQTVSCRAQPPAVRVGHWRNCGSLQVCPLEIGATGRKGEM